MLLYLTTSLIHPKVILWAIQTYLSFRDWANRLDRQ